MSEPGRPSAGLPERLRELAEALERGEPTEVDVPALERALSSASGPDASAAAPGAEAHERQRVEPPRSSEARLCLALSAARAMIYSRDLNLETLLELRGSSHVIGDAPLGTPIDDEWLESRVHPDDVLRVAVERSALLAKDTRRACLRYRLRHCDGHYVTVEDHALVLHGEGHVGRCVGVVIDAQERAKYEETSERHARLEDESLATLARELRNPLAAIQSAMDRVPTTRDLDPPLAEVVEVVARQSRHMRGLVDSLLDASRIARGKVELATEPVDLQHVLEQAAHDARPRFAESGVELSVRDPQTPRRVLGDRLRLKQVLDNLLANAAQHADRYVTVESGTGGGEVWLAVQDDGPGLDEAALEDVFGPFFQGPRRRDRPERGLGLGLSMARGLAQLHHGRLVAHSEGPSTGARFVVHLPQTDRAAVRPGSPRQPRAPQGLSRVLLVEDNDDVATMIAIGLDRHGFEVRVAGTGKAALAALDASAPDVMICDVGLPGGMDGFEVASRAKRLAPSVRLVAMTGYGGSADRRLAREVGFEAFLVKPLPLLDLVTALLQL